MRSDIHLQHSLFDKLEGSRWSSDERYFSAYCPFEDHRKPAILVFADGYTCLSCNSSGGLKYLQNFISRGTINFTHKSSLKPVLPRWRKWQERFGDIPDIAYAAHRMADEYDMRSYFKKRKIDQFFECGMFGKLDGWITLPVFDKNKEIVDLVVRAGPGKGEESAKYVISPHPKGGIRPLYCPNWERIFTADYIYVPFGMFDAWAFEDLQLGCLTGITGKSINPDSFFGINKEIRIVPDFGEDDAAAKLANSLGWRGKIVHIKYPDDCKDPDEIRRFHGKDVLRELL